MKIIFLLPRLSVDFRRFVILRLPDTRLRDRPRAAILRFAAVRLRGLARGVALRLVKARFRDALLTTDFRVRFRLVLRFGVAILRDRERCNANLAPQFGQSIDFFCRIVLRDRLVFRLRVDGERFILLARAGDIDSDRLVPPNLVLGFRITSMFRFRLCGWSLIFTF